MELWRFRALVARGALMLLTLSAIEGDRWVSRTLWLKREYREIVCA